MQRQPIQLRTNGNYNGFHAYRKTHITHTRPKITIVAVHFTGKKCQLFRPFCLHSHSHVERRTIFGLLMFQLHIMFCMYFVQCWTPLLECGWEYRRISWMIECRWLHRECKNDRSQREMKHVRHPEAFSMQQLFSNACGILFLRSLLFSRLRRIAAKYQFRVTKSARDWPKKSCRTMSWNNEYNFINWLSVESLWRTTAAETQKNCTSKSIRVQHHKKKHFTSKPVIVARCDFCARNSLIIIYYLKLVARKLYRQQISIHSYTTSHGLLSLVSIVYSYTNITFTCSAACTISIACFN